MQRPDWRLSTADMLAHEFRVAAQTFFDLVVDPSCIRLATSEASISADQYSAAYQAAINAREARKVLALSFAGLWESQFREHISHSSATLPIEKEIQRKARSNRYSELEEAFEEMRDFPLFDFSTYATIKGLVLVANAARHGNGTSSSRVYREYPQYFSPKKPFDGAYSYVLHGAARDDDVRYLDITAAHLEQFRSAIVKFWFEISELAQAANDGPPNKPGSIDMQE